MGHRLVCPLLLFLRAMSSGYPICFARHQNVNKKPRIAAGGVLLKESDNV